MNSYLRISFAAFLSVFIMVGEAYGGKQAPGGKQVPIPEFDKSWSKEDRLAIAAARKHLESRDKMPINAAYSVTRSDKKIAVHVAYIAGYEKNGMPIYKLGGHCTVLLDENLKPLAVLPGA